MNYKENYIKSLHRPFNTRLKTIKWVCEFASTYDGNQFKIDFFIFIVDFLNAEYEKCESIYGLPKKETISNLLEFINSTDNIKDVLLEFNNPSKKNVKPIDKQLFSNIKAVSYYITMAKNLGFIKKEKLTEKGLELVNCRNSPKSFIVLTQKEQDIFINQLLEYDFIPFNFTIFYTYFENKYRLTDNEKLQFNEKILKDLDKFLNTRDFKLKRQSWKNYIIVRQSWIKDLELIQSNNVIKSKFKALASLQSLQDKEYNKISELMLKFEKNFFKKLEKYKIFKKNLYSAYNIVKKKNLFKSIGYINLYDIKKILNINFNQFEIFLEMLITEEVSKRKSSDQYIRKIFFNNIVSAIDTRKRFNINKTQVLNIKISGVLS